MSHDRILLDDGSGGRASQRLISELFLSRFDNPELCRLNDAAVLQPNGRIAVSTDSFTVDPIVFPGGNIGSLAVHGTVNDVAMLGARPRWLTCGFILEEGFAMDELRVIVDAMAEAARESGVAIVTGDTKVVPKGAVDRIFINTTGIGEIIVDPTPSGDRAQPGDAVLISGSMGDHGLTIMAARSELDFEITTASDSASLNHMIAEVLAAAGDAHVLRDPTRGGLATTLNEIAAASGVSIEIEEAAVPVAEGVMAGCSFLGLDPLYLANEGKLICIVPEEKADTTLEAMRKHPVGANAVRIGTVQAADPGKVILVTTLGGRRLLSMLEGEQLPRIC